MNRVNIRSAIEEKFDDGPRVLHNCPMKRRAARTVAAIQQGGIGIKKLTNAGDIPRVDSQMNRMILASLRRRGSAATVAVFLQNPDDNVVTALLRHVDQAVSIVAVPLGVRPRVKQHLDDFRVSLANSKMDRRRVEISVY